MNVADFLFFCFSMNFELTSINQKTSNKLIFSQKYSLPD